MVTMQNKKGKTMKLFSSFEKARTALNKEITMDFTFDSMIETYLALKEIVDEITVAKIELYGLMCEEYPDELNAYDVKENLMYAEEQYNKAKQRAEEL